jgi:hypothetical protein
VERNATQSVIAAASATQDNMLRYVSVVCMALLTLDCTFHPTPQLLPHHPHTRGVSDARFDHTTPGPSTGESEDQLLAMGVLTHVTSFLKDLQPHVRVASCFLSIFCFFVLLLKIKIVLYLCTF